MQNIGEAIYIYRRRAGLSQAEVARDAGIHRNTLSALENGDVNVTLGVLVAVCRALDRSLSVVIGETECRLTKRSLDAVCSCGSPEFYTDKVLGVVCCRCQAPRR